MSSVDPSVCLSVCDAMHALWLNDTSYSRSIWACEWAVSVLLGTRRYNFQHSTSTSRLEPSNSPPQKFLMQFDRVSQQQRCFLLGYYDWRVRPSQQPVDWPATQGQQQHATSWPVEKIHHTWSFGTREWRYGPRWLRVDDESLAVIAYSDRMKVDEIAIGLYSHDW